MKLMIAQNAAQISILKSKIRLKSFITFLPFLSFVYLMRSVISKSTGQNAMSLSLPRRVCTECNDD